MKQKKHRQESIIGLVVGVIFAALTALVVTLFRQRSQPAIPRMKLKALSENEPVLVTEPITTQEYEMESAVVQSKPVVVEPNLPSKTDIVDPPAKKVKIWSLPTKYMVSAGLVIFLLWLFYFSRGSITLILFSGLLALVAGGVIDFFKKRFKMSNGLSITITYLLIVVILISIPLLLLPALIDSVSSLFSADWQTISSNIAQFLDQTAAQISRIPVVGSMFQESLTALADLLEQSSTMSQNAAVPVITLESLAGTIGRTLGGLAAILGPLISAGATLVFMLLMSLQMTVGGGDLRKGLVDTIPTTYRDEIDHLLDGITIVWKSFLQGQVLLMFTMGAATWLLNLLLGTPYPLFLGVLAGFLEIIPSLGPVLAYIPAVILALVFGSTRFTGMEPWVFALILSAGYLLLSALENQLLVPRIMGSAVNLPPLVVLIGIIIAGATIGLAGVFLAVPIIATGREVFLYLYGKVLETEGDLPPPENTDMENGQIREFIQSATARIRGWFGGKKNPSPK